MKRFVLLIAALALSSCGGGDSGSAAARTVEIEMVDIAFKPTTLSVARGETVEFVFTNSGKVDHDAFVGSRKAQDAHETEMRDGSDGHDHGGDEDAVTVKPGKTGRLRHTFGEAGTVEIGCHQPGHYSAGMKVTVEVV